MSFRIAPFQPHRAPASAQRLRQSPRGFFLAPVRVSRHAGSIMSCIGSSLAAICPSERACLTFVSMMSCMRREDERSRIDPGDAEGTPPSPRNPASGE